MKKLIGMILTVAIASTLLVGCYSKSCCNNGCSTGNCCMKDGK